MPVVEEEELDEEKSLFDPLPIPGPSNLPRAIPEEPAGPKSRLVIHKLVLINFKSYAGRQEIGPFHKVMNIGQRNVLRLLADFFDSHSRSLPLWVLMDQENPILLMLSYLYSDTVPRR